MSVMDIRGLYESFWLHSSALPNRWFILLGLLTEMLRLFVHGQDCLPLMAKYVGYGLRSDKQLQPIFNLKTSESLNTPTVSFLSDCVLRCKKNETCGAIAIGINGNSSLNRDITCIGYDRALTAIGYEQLIDGYLQRISSLSWFIHKQCMRTAHVSKTTCIDAANKCVNNSQLWQFDNVPGYQLISNAAVNGVYNGGTAITAATLADCQSACLLEATFICRSLSYRSSTKQCLLYQIDRRSVASKALGAVVDSSVKFTTTQADDVYTETSCYTPTTSADCDFTSEVGPAMQLSWSIPIENASIGEQSCQLQCEQYLLFACRSYSYEQSTGECRLSPDDSHSFVATAAAGNGQLMSRYKQKQMCVEVEIECAAGAIRANLSMDRPFNGRFYALGSNGSNATQCSLDVHNGYKTVLTYPLPKTSMQRCNVVKESNGHEYSITAMMQYHDTIVTSNDRLFKFICSYDLQPQQVENSVLFRIDNDANSTRVPGSVVRGNGRRPLPQAIMRIVNADGIPVSIAEVGQTLYSEVLLNGDNGGSIYGLFVTNCSASIGIDPTVQLVDSVGCPIDTNVFEGFTPLTEAGQTRLKAAFRGFRFESQARVNINCDVNLCYEFCEPALCTDKNGRRIQTYGKKRRRRRRAAANELSSQTVQQQSFVATMGVSTDVTVVIPGRSLMSLLVNDFIVNRTYLGNSQQSRQQPLAFLPLFLVTVSLTGLTICTLIIVYKHRFNYD